MAFTYDPTTDRGKVRLLIPDTDTADSNNQLFTDAEIDTFLTMEDSNIKRAAALAIETTARNQALVLKVIRLLDLQTDGAAVARELRMQAKELRAQAHSDEAEDDGGAFDWAEMVPDTFSARERIRNEYLRSLG